MNKDQVKGKSKEITDDGQEQAGRSVGNKDPQSKGQSREIDGKSQQRSGNHKQTTRESPDHTT